MAELEAMEKRWEEKTEEDRRHIEKRLKRLRQYMREIDYALSMNDSTKIIKGTEEQKSPEI
jgi:hypothetical protein